MKMSVYSFKKIVRESYRILIVTVLIGLASGYMLEAYSGRITAIILAMVPPINGIGGNIGSILGARLSSALHLGTVTPDFRENEPLKTNIFASASLGVIVYGFIGLFFFVSSLITGSTALESIRVAMIFFGAGILLISIIIFTSVSSAFISYSRGTDPDNVVIPVVTTIVDVAGVISLLMMIRIIGM